MRVPTPRKKTVGKIWRHREILLAGGSRERPLIWPQLPASEIGIAVGEILPWVIPGSRLLTSFPVGRSPSAKFVAFETARAKAAPLQVWLPTSARRILRSDRIPGSHGRPVFVDADS